MVTVVKRQCPKCAVDLIAAVPDSTAEIVLTPCCGWVGDDPVPCWAQESHDRVMRSKEARTS